MKNLKTVFLIILLPILLIVLLIKAQQHFRFPGQPPARPIKHDHKDKDSENPETAEHQEYIKSIPFGDWRG